MTDGSAATAALISALEERLTSTASTDPAAAMRWAAQVERIAAAGANRAVAAARGGGASWSEVGAAFGISKQAAHQRFARHVRAAGG
jgi:hypothetical protein